MSLGTWLSLLLAKIIMEHKKIYKQLGTVLIESNSKLAVKNFDKAITVLRENILSGEVEGNEIDIADEYLEFAKVICNKGKDGHAIPMYRKALEIQLEHLGEEDNSYIDTLWKP